MIVSSNTYFDYLKNMQNPSNDINISSHNVSALAINTNKSNIDNYSMDNFTVSNSFEMESEKFENWTYNTTDDGYLPDFKLGDWENTSHKLFGNNTVVSEKNTYSIYLPSSLQEKMKESQEFAKEINAKLEDFFKSNMRENTRFEDGTLFKVSAQYMAVSMDENGTITHSYIRTESYSIANALDNVANDENIFDKNSQYNNLATFNYGFATYQLNMELDAHNSMDTQKSGTTSLNIKTVMIIENAQVTSNMPEIKIRQADGDIVELETGKLITKYIDYSDNFLKYDNKA